jgi:hypothetical protein
MSYIFVICYSYCEVKRIAKKKSGGSRNGMMRRAWHKTRDRMELESVVEQARKMTVQAGLGQASN